MKPDQEIVATVQGHLEQRLGTILLCHGRPPDLAHQMWTYYLEGIGAKRVGKLMGIIVQPQEGIVRLKDPLGSGGNDGFIEMDEETFNKIATLGLP